MGDRHAPSIWDDDCPNCPHCGLPTPDCLCDDAGDS